MGKILFVAGTGTDIGKTYISALIVKRLRDCNLNAGYYKAAASGVELDTNGNLIGGDPVFVNDFANIGEDLKNLVSYVYAEPLSPHLAARINNRHIDLDVISRDLKNASDKYEYLVVEGSGGVICPLRWDNISKITTLDIVKKFNIPMLLVADAGLGTINSTVLTVDYLNSHNFKVNSIIANRFTNNAMCNDNISMIEELTNLPVIAKVSQDSKNLEVEINLLTSLFS